MGCALHSYRRGRVWGVATDLIWTGRSISLRQSTFGFVMVDRSLAVEKSTIGVGE